MIFYFSGIYPAGLRDFPDDEEMNAFRAGGYPYNRMVCPVYEKEAEQIYRNVRRAKKYDDRQKGIAGSAEERTASRSRKG